MAIAQGIRKQVNFKKETTFGTAPSAGSAQTLRRVTANFNLKKESYESAEIRTDYQTIDMRHGTRSSEGSLNGELSPGTYNLFLAAAMGKDFAATTSITAASLTVAGTGPTFTITRAAGSYLTDGVKIGDVVRLTAGAFNAANLNKNLLVTALTATIATVVVLNGVVMFAEGPIASATMAIPGKKTFAPLTAHTDDSFTFEQWFSDILQSERFVGNKVDSIALDLPASGLTKIDMAFKGKDMDLTGSAQYFTSPTAETTAGIYAAVNGVVLAQGVSVALITGAKLTINRGQTMEPVVGSNTVPDIFEGRILVSGELTVFMQDGVFRDYFAAETEVSIALALTTSSAAAADFTTFVIPRVKFSGTDKDDGEKGLVQTMPFTALRLVAGGTGIANEATTLSIQDSLA